MASVRFPAAFLSVSFLSIAVAAAQPVLPEDPVSLLGMTPAQAMALLGPPVRVYAVRGAEPWQDDVAFDFGGGLALFFYADRVWQVGVSVPYALPVLGFVLGADVERASAVLGTPVLVLDGAVEWDLPGADWPVRLRGLVDASGRIVTTLYLYRADF